MESNESIVIVGGTGVVGRQIAQLVRRRHGGLPLIIAGRDPEKARQAALAIPQAQAAAVDVEQPLPLKGLKPRAVIAAVNDPGDHLLMEAARRGIPLLDITRWTERVRQANQSLGDETLKAPILLASGWMAGVAALVAAAAARPLHRADSIDINVLYSLKDKSGPNSVEYMDRLATPFTVMREGAERRVSPLSDPVTVDFPGGYRTKTYRFDTPDQMTLPRTLGAGSVSARIAFDDKAATKFLVFLTRSGLWKLISGSFFAPLRRSLLYNPGSGASHEIVIDLRGWDSRGKPVGKRAIIADPQGQTHLTAVGALVQLERLLGLDGHPPLPPGIHYPDSSPALDSALRLMADCGVRIELDSQL